MQKKEHHKPGPLQRVGHQKKKLCVAFMMFIKKSIEGAGVSVKAWREALRAGGAISCHAAEKEYTPNLTGMSLFFRTVNRLW